jgi:formylmethanofuran dehydrogenase subunit B
VTAIAHYPCVGCSCVCDDITLTLDGSRIVAADRACAIGRDLLLADVAEPPDTSADDLARAADMLSSARRPVFRGFAWATIETQRAIVELADLCGGCVDPGSSAVSLWPEIGSVTCSYGEVMNRARHLYVWGGEPHRTHPRFLERYFRGDGITVIGNAATAQAWSATAHIELEPADSFAALWTLRAAVRGHRVPEPWQSLAAHMRQTQPVVIVHSATGRDADAAHGLAADLNVVVRAYVVPLVGPGNAIGAQQVATWQTGFAGAVSLGPTGPESYGELFSAARLLETGDTDLVVTFGPDADRPADIPQIHIAAQSTPTSGLFLACAAFPTHTSGTVFRGDGIAMPLPQAIRSSLPADFEVVQSLIAKVRTSGDRTTHP